MSNYRAQEHLSDVQFVTGQEGLNLQECWNDISLHTLCDSFAFIYGNWEVMVFCQVTCETSGFSFGKVVHQRS